MSIGMNEHSTIKEFSQFVLILDKWMIKCCVHNCTQRKYKMGFFSWLQIKSSENALDMGSILLACHMLFFSFLCVYITKFSGSDFRLFLKVYLFDWGSIAFVVHCDQELIWMDIIYYINELFGKLQHFRSSKRVFSPIYSSF